MIQREIRAKVLELSKYYPILTITGPRQSGKTTLVKQLFPDKPYVLLENPDVRQRAEDDPLSFLDKYPNGAILDEVQNTPFLFSYLQGIVDENKEIKFVLSGSQNFLLLEQINQSLAGRTAIIKLLPFSLEELKLGVNSDPFSSIFKGMYPPIYDRKIPPTDFYNNYIQTYVERDVRKIKNIGNLSDFRRFLSLCAGRVGQLLNLNSLATECGVSLNTTKSWISILEASYILYRLQPHHKNFNKRLVKRPKLYFYDTGLACNLLRIKSKEDLDIHFARGNLFENFILNELLKNRWNKGEHSDLYFWRDKHGKEIDCILEKSNELLAIEIKAGKTYRIDFFKNLDYWRKISGKKAESTYVIYAGDESDKHAKGTLLSWKTLKEIE